MQLYDIETIFAFLLAIVVHELGHIIAIFLMGMRVKNVKLELSGIKIEYSGIASEDSETFVALCGPLAGIAYFLVIHKANAFFALSGELSLIYSFFNIMPIAPLDGGRIILLQTEKIDKEDRINGFVYRAAAWFCVTFFVFGLINLLKGEGGGMFAAGIWLLLLQNETKVL